VLSRNATLEDVRAVDAIQGAHFWLDRLSVSMVTEERWLRVECLALDAARVELLASEEERCQAGEAER
jgi:predicted RNA-binding protein with PUA-like domain